MPNGLGTVVTRYAGLGVTGTVNTAHGSVTRPLEATTVTAAVPLLPSLVAVTVADPTARPVTRPLLDTFAIVVSLVVHVTTRPESGLPFASLGVAASCTVDPCDTLVDAGLSVTDATGTIVTETADVPLFASLVAVIVAEPAARPVTSPLFETLAIVVSLLVHATSRPVSGLPFASFGAAVSCTVCPT